MAAGVTIRSEKLDAFRDYLEESMRESVAQARKNTALAVDGVLTASACTPNLVEEIEKAGPFGSGNPEPVFGLKAVRLRHRPEIFKEQHFRFHIDDENGRRIYGVAWKLAQRVPPTGVPLDLAVQIGWNVYNDRKQLQMELLDWRPTADVKSS